MKQLVPRMAHVGGSACQWHSRWHFLIFFFFFAYVEYRAVATTTACTQSNHAEKVFAINTMLLPLLHFACTYRILRNVPQSYTTPSVPN